MSSPLVEVSYSRRASLHAVKLLPGGNEFICECCRVKCDAVSLDYHHKIPQEAGGADDAENIAALCVNCHQLLHRLAVRMTSSRAYSQTPLEVAQHYATRANPRDPATVVKNILEFAQLVAAYRVQKADNAIAPPDSIITVAEMPRRYIALFKQISWEIKRGDGRGVGMSNLAAIAVVQLIAKHRPELRTELDAWIRDTITMPVEKAREVLAAVEDFEEHSL